VTAAVARSRCVKTAARPSAAARRALELAVLDRDGLRALAVAATLRARAPRLALPTLTDPDR